MDKKLKVLLVFDCPFFAPRGYDFKEEFKDPDWDAERSVAEALLQNGHDVALVGIHNDIGVLIEEVRENRPDVIFNLVEVFNNQSHLEKNVAAFLDLLGIPFTGATAPTLLICNNKALNKKILAFHRMKVPNFHTYYRTHKIRVPKRTKLPLIVKPLKEEASRGISQASIVDNEDALVQRVKFIHESMDADAIAEEYINGREFYVSIFGMRNVEVFPLREMKFGQFAEDEPRIATYKAKWDHDYRRRWGIKNVFAGRLPEGWEKKITEICKRAYRVLNIRSYVRFDVRVTPEGGVYIIEANANPNLAPDDEFAESAGKSGVPYNRLIQKILNLALQRDG